jgi:endonuclease-3 related protein
MFDQPWPRLREELLAQRGIGPETADAILLYGGRQPVFVVDAYTMRIFRRHRLVRPKTAAEAVRAWVMREWPNDAARYNEFHALLVEIGKRFCHRRDPVCHACPLRHHPHTRH